MLLLTSPNDRLQIVTSAAAIINAHTSWVDTNTGTGTITPGRTNTAVSAAATTSIAGAAASGVQRNVKSAHIRNVDATLPCDVTVQHTDGTTAVQLYKLTLAPGDQLEYTDQGGFGWITAAGASGGGSGGGGGGGFTTGDVKPTFKTVADAGWIIPNDGSIGNAASGGTTRANNDTQALFTLLYNAVPTLVLQTSAGTTTARGANAAADYGANRRLLLPLMLGRALVQAGAGAGLASHALGSITGAETHTQTLAELASHLHTGIGATDGSVQAPLCGGPDGFGNMDYSGPNGTQNWQMLNAGGGSPMNILNPRTHVNFMIKL